MNYLSSLKRLSAVGFVSLIVGGGTMGCGGDDTTGVSPPPPVADAAVSDTGSVLQTITITETEYHLEPSAVTLNAPGLYMFHVENRGTIVHSFSIRDGVSNTLVNNLNPNDNGDLMVSLQAGMYTMFCPIPGHEQLGMVGTIMVKPTS
jgi:uncharacterized cupredoxin-like copper-binding protein